MMLQWRLRKPFWQATPFSIYRREWRDPAYCGGVEVYARRYAASRLVWEIMHRPEQLAEEREEQAKFLQERRQGECEIPL
jgi:hypothetical protein